jgi:hypothetical protein
VIAGARLKSSVNIDVSDAGSEFNGSATVTLFASTAPSLTAATAIGSPITSKLKLFAGKSKTYVFSVTHLPISLSAGSYYLVADVAGADASSSPAVSNSGFNVALPFVELSGSNLTIVNVKPGKKSTATVEVTNNGNTPATGTLGVAISARPAGTTGEADSIVQLVSAKINIKPMATAKVRLSFLIPPSLPAQAYSLIAQLDPNNTFNESVLTPLIVGTQTFSVR